MLRTSLIGLLCVFLTTANGQASPHLPKHLPLFSGPVFGGYPSTYEGSPYFLGSDYAMGEITYRGIEYSQVPINFDAISQQFIVKHPEVLYPISLENTWVDQVSIMGNRFAPLNDEKLKLSGLSQLLVKKDSIALFENHKKIVRKQPEGEQLRFIISNNNRFILSYKGDLYEIDHKRDFYRLDKKFKSELKSAYRSQNLNWKKNPQEAFSALTQTLIKLNSANDEQ